MQDSTILYRPAPPFILVDEYTDKDKKWLPAKRYQYENREAEIRVLRGSKMQTYQGLMDEFGAALQFFEGFGENWAALEECLCYMDEWLPAETYIVEIVDGQRTLAEEENEDFGTFLRLLNRVGDWWARPIVDNPPYDRPAIPFHAVIKVPPAEWDSLVARIAEFTDLEPTVMTSRHA